MRNEARFNCMEIQNSKSSGNIYSNFEDKVGVLPRVYFIHTIFFFQRQRIQKSNVSNSVQIKAEMKKLWSFEDNYAKLKGRFEIISKFNL